MDTYLYVGRNSSGQLTRGKIESWSSQAVASTLLASGVTPVSITLQRTEKAQPGWLRSLQGERALGQVELLMFTKQMATMVRAGVPILQALIGMQKATDNPRMVELLQAMREDLDKGRELSKAMARHRGFFSDYYLNMVKVGEGSGRLDEVMFRLVDQLDFDRQMRQKIKSAMRYPTFVLAAIVVAIGVVSVFVIPVFAGVYAGMKVELPALTLFLLGMSDFAVNYWWVVVAVGALVVYMVKMFLATEGGRGWWDARKIRLPVLGPIVVKATIARFFVGFTIASRSGVPLLQSFSLLAQVVDNAFYAERVLQMREGIERGESLLKVAESTGIFKPLELQMIAIGEETGEVDNMLEQVARMYQEELEYEVNRISESIEPIMLVLMGGLVTVLLLGIFLPLWDLGSAASKSM